MIKYVLHNYRYVKRLIRALRKAYADHRDTFPLALLRHSIFWIEIFFYFLYFQRIRFEREIPIFLMIFVTKEKSFFSKEYFTL